MPEDDIFSKIVFYRGTDKDEAGENPTMWLQRKGEEIQTENYFSGG